MKGNCWACAAPVCPRARLAPTQPHSCTVCLPQVGKGQVLVLGYVTEQVTGPLCASVSQSTQWEYQYLHHRAVELND